MRLVFSMVLAFMAGNIAYRAYKHRVLWQHVLAYWVMVSLRYIYEAMGGR